jgi:murein DD-endopeptidase MepM/ murein hydrolase activator NlpD
MGGILRNKSTFHVFFLVLILGLASCSDKGGQAPAPEAPKKETVEAQEADETETGTTERILHVDFPPEEEQVEERPEVDFERLPTPEPIIPEVVFPEPQVEEAEKPNETIRPPKPPTPIEPDAELPEPEAPEVEEEQMVDESTTESELMRLCSEFTIESGLCYCELKSGGRVAFSSEDHPLCQLSRGEEDSQDVEEPTEDQPNEEPEQPADGIEAMTSELSEEVQDSVDLILAEPLIEDVISYLSDDLNDHNMSRTDFLLCMTAHCGLGSNISSIRSCKPNGASYWAFIPELASNATDSLRKRCDRFSGNGKKFSDIAGCLYRDGGSADKEDCLAQNDLIEAGENYWENLIHELIQYTENPLPVTSIDFIPQRRRGELLDFSKSNIAKKVGPLFSALSNTSETTVSLCDQSLSTWSQIRDYSKIARCDQGGHHVLYDIKEAIRNEVSSRGRRCLQVQNLYRNWYRVTRSDSLNKELVFYIKDCTSDVQGEQQYDCTYRQISFNDGDSQTIQLNYNDEVMVLQKDEPISCGDFPETRDYKTPSVTYNIRPKVSPANRRARVTQCYDGTYSHQNTYAIDIGMNVGERVRSMDTGVVVIERSGSGVQCVSSGSAPNRIFRIYKDGNLVDNKLKACTNCYYTSFQTVCRGTNSANHVYVAHTDNTYGYYSHLSKNNPESDFGDVLTTSSFIGQIGLSGWITGAHLHAEIYRARAGNGLSRLSGLPVYIQDTASSAVYPCSYNRSMDIYNASGKYLNNVTL